MNDDQLDRKHLSRRDLLRRAGLGGLNILAAGAVGSRPISISAASARDDSPEGFLAYAFAKRSQSMTTGETHLLDLLYDPASGPLLSFERERARFFSTGLGAQCHSSILSFDSTVSLIDLSFAGSAATCHIYETVRMLWVPHPRPSVALPAQVLQRRAREPGRFRSTLPVGPRG